MNMQRIEAPTRIRRLPVDERGYHVPKFATWFDGRPDFRLADTEWLIRALDGRRCFICGDPLGRMMAFVIGPMCAINRVSAEPPCHRDCAEYAVQVCPFLCFPQRGRNDADKPANKLKPAGIMIEHNPGVALVWITKSYEVEIEPIHGKRGALLRIGPHVERSWWHRGRRATLDEVLSAFTSGLPRLREIARLYDGPDGQREIEEKIAATIKSVREEAWHAP